MADDSNTPSHAAPPPPPSSSSTNEANTRQTHTHTHPHTRTSLPPQPPPPPPIGERQNEPSRTGFDPEKTWFVNYFRAISGRMTREGLFDFRESRYKVHEESDCRRCEEFRDHSLAYSPVVRFLGEKIALMGGPAINASNIHCRRCPARLDENGNVLRQSGGFSPVHGILMCANEIRDRKHFEDSLAHEMVHAWDFLRWKIDYDGKDALRHAACTEIRASMLSGECRWMRWGKEARAQGDYTIMQQFQKCVKGRAVLSMMARPKIRDEEHAARVVGDVWPSCFADTRPFDEVYK